MKKIKKNKFEYQNYGQYLVCLGSWTQHNDIYRSSRETTDHTKF